jgi:hypothetical protein
MSQPLRGPVRPPKLDGKNTNKVFIYSYLGIGGYAGGPS